VTLNARQMLTTQYAKFEKTQSTQIGKITVDTNVLEK
jgi:hypothetical protein